MIKKCSNKSIVIAGAGLTGLMSAIKLRQLYPDKEIIVFDRAHHVGGMYSSLSYSQSVMFDYGMHIIYESCNKEIDDLYTKVMPKSEWHMYENNEKDIAGLFFNGRLQTYSHYIDLRTFSQKDRNIFTGSLMHMLDKPDSKSPNNVMDFLRNQFGCEIADVVHRPILHRMYGIDPEDLDVFAIKATALERVVLFDSAIMLDLMKSSKLRERLAFPDQLNLPPIRTNNQKALYPRKFGMVHFVDRLRSYLESIDVDVLTETDIQHIRQQRGRIKQITLNSKKSGIKNIAVDRLLWTVGWPLLSKQLNLDISDLKFQKGPEIIFVNLSFNRPLLMERLYYFYCYDDGFATFRVTNYSNYCPGAAQDGWFPLCVELWPSKIGKKRTVMEINECIELAVDELKRFGVIGVDHKLIFAKVENDVSEFPMPSLENKKSLKVIRSRVEDLEIKNLTVAGIMASDDLFFIPDILNDAFSKLHSL